MYRQDTTFSFTKFLQGYYNIYGVKFLAYPYSI